MSRAPEPYEPNDPLDHKSRRSKIRRYRALHKDSDHGADSSDNFSSVFSGIALVGIFILLYVLFTIFPALGVLIPFILILGMVAALLAISQSHQFIALSRYFRPDSRSERARRHHEEKLLRADQKLADREFTIGADGELVFGEKKKDQSAASDD